MHEGDMVKQGQVMGLSGMTGMAGGDHIHFAMQLDGVQIDPKEWWDRTGSRTTSPRGWSCRGLVGSLGIWYLVFGISRWRHESLLKSGVYLLTLPMTPHFLIFARTASFIRSVSRVSTFFQRSQCFSDAKTCILKAHDFM